MTRVDLTDSPASTDAELTVAVTVEQFWERVPGGTATSLAACLRAHRDLPARQRSRLVGVSAMHRRPPAPAFATGLVVRRLPLPRPVLYDLWRTARQPRVELVTGRVDVLHATTMAIPPATAPLVVTVHDLAFRDDPSHFTARGLRFFEAGFELVRRHAARVLVPSRDTLQACVEAGMEQDRLRLVQWGVDPYRGGPEEVERVRRQFGLRSDYLLWCGTLEPRKNLPTLLAAFAQVATERPELDLVIVGPQGWGDALGSGQMPPADRVKLLGYVAAQDLSALYAGARAFCFPSLSEGFGLPVLEAMAAGTPVVTSTHTPMADLIGAAGLAAPALDVTALADAILTVTGPARSEFAAAARPRAAEFTWASTARATQAAYAEAAAGR